MASGFNVVDFMDLPPVERCIIRLVLRETTVTYPELVDAVMTLPVEQQMDQPTFEAALDHLTFSEWLIRQTYGQQTTYRVNTLQKMPAQRQGLLEGLDLEKIDAPSSLRLTVDTADHSLLGQRGKRVLPTHIWDCLTETGAEKPVSEAPKRRASLFDKFADGDGGSKKL